MVQRECTPCSRRRNRPQARNSAPPRSVKATGDHRMSSSRITRYSSLLILLLALRAAPVAADRDATELLDWARPKVVLVYVQLAGSSRWGTGFLAERDRVITNEHVVQDARAITICANGTPYPAHVAVLHAL